MKDNLIEFLNISWEWGRGNTLMEYFKRISLFCKVQDVKVVEENAIIQSLGLVLYSVGL